MSLPPISDPSFRSALRALRIKHGLTQAKLAARIDILPANIGRYENQTASQPSLPSDATWSRLNAFFQSLESPKVISATDAGSEVPVNVLRIPEVIALEIKLNAEYRKFGAKSVSITVNW